jgi:aryl-alcohol dehydrogenase-like predicted oxidoreductase
VTPAQLALGWVDQVDGVTSTIIGATSMLQLKDDLSVFEKPLSESLLTEVGELWKLHPMPF